MRRATAVGAAVLAVAVLVAVACRSAPAWVVAARGLVELPRAYAEPGWVSLTVDTRTGAVVEHGFGPGLPLWWDGLRDRVRDGAPPGRMASALRDTLPWSVPCGWRVDG